MNLLWRRVPVALAMLVVAGGLAACVPPPPPTAAVEVSVGYADGTRASSANFPRPWAGSPGVVFEGCDPNVSSCTYDAGAVRVLNNTTSSVTVNSVAVHVDTCTYTGWPSVTLSPGQSLIVTQLRSGSPFFGGCSGPKPDFVDTSDVGPGGKSYASNCTPNGIIPTVDITVNGTTTTYTDSGQILNTGGFDTAGCPSPTNESIPWSSVGSRKSAVQQVKHIIVLVQENRSADNYFGQLNAQGQPGYEAQPNPPVNPNPDPVNGGNINPFLKTDVCDSSDLSHSWNATHLQWDNGSMDGFTKANDSNPAQNPDGASLFPLPDVGTRDPSDPSGRRTMGYYDKTLLPFYYSLYNTFATGDRYFSSVLSGTYPNRFYLLAGTSFGHIDNDNPGVTITGQLKTFPNTTIFDQLNNATPSISWKYYYGTRFLGNPGTVAWFFNGVRQQSNNVVQFKPQFFQDVANDTLPAVSFIDPTFFDTGNPPNTATDEHPPANVQVGQDYTYQIINALENSKAWSSSVLFLTYDEAGGYYDHVPPPAATAPDGIAPMHFPRFGNPTPLGPNDQPGDFTRYGIRVPIVAVSPFAKAHYVSHVIHDHTSIIAFIESRFGLPPLASSKRVAVADPMLEFFNFAQPPFLNNKPQFAAPAVTLCPLVVATNELPGGKVGTDYSSFQISTTLTARNGMTPYAWSIANGALPPGLNLDASTGAITGTPTTAGTFSFTVKVTDSTVPTAQTATKSLQITVAP